MTQFKVGDRVTIGRNNIDVAVGTIFTVVDTLQEMGVWVDVNRKEVMLKYVDKGSKNCFADFTLVEEDKVKNKFAVGDKVISTKNTPNIPEGFIGYIFSAEKGPDWDYMVLSIKNGVVEYFNEDELELLSAGQTSVSIQQTTADIARPVLEERKIGKVKMELFDEGFPNAIMEIARVMTWAAEHKGYKPHDWKQLPNADTEFSAAASRHKVKSFIQKVDGVEALQRTDEESKIVHLAHTAFNVLAELELVLTGVIK